LKFILEEGKRGEQGWGREYFWAIVLSNAISDQHPWERQEAAEWKEERSQLKYNKK
jgi:hypothetical protein